MTGIIRTAGSGLFALLAWQVFVPSRAQEAGSVSRLWLTVTDSETGKPIAARFTLNVDGKEHEPRWLGSHGLRFASVHPLRPHVAVLTYSRGTGPVEVAMPAGVKRVTVRVTKGFDYVPSTVEAAVGSESPRVDVVLRRWNRLREAGWRAADTHLHYDRVEPEGDRDWFDAMDGDGLAHANFLVLKAGGLGRVWAEQYAYGKRGEGTDGDRLIVPGEEYRDQLQGHFLLFGLNGVIQPIMAGTPDSPDNYPLSVQMLKRARDLGGIVGAAHGATLSKSPTGIVDGVLKAMDFIEIGNLFIWELENWYRLMDVGVVLPPTAGSDLPNYPARDWWQPFLGSIRTYVQVGERRTSEAWNQAVLRGQVFVTSGPMIRLSVNGVEPGGTVRLPEGGGEVDVEAELSSPRELKLLEIVKNSQVIALTRTGKDRLIVRRKVLVSDSCWIAARGVGAYIDAFRRDAVAHTSAVRVLVGNRPIWSAAVAARLTGLLEKQREFYRANGTYSRPEQREEALEVFDRAISALRAPPKL